MAEIGLIASVIGVAGAGIKLSITLYTFSETVATAADSIKSIAKDVSLTSAVLEELGSNLRQDEQAHLYSGTALRTAQTVVVDCEAVFKQIDSALSKSMERIGGLASSGKSKGKGGKVVLSAIERLKWPFLQPKMQELRANLERLKSTLVLMLNVLTYARKIHTEKQSQPSKDDYQRLLIENLVAANQKATRNFQTLLRTIGSSDETGSITTTSTRELSIGESTLVAERAPSDEMRASSGAGEADFKQQKASETSLAHQPRDMPAPDEHSGINQFTISGTSLATETTMACLKRIQEALDQFEASEDKIASATLMKVSIEVCKHILHSESGPRVSKPWEVASIVRHQDDKALGLDDSNEPPLLVSTRLEAGVPSRLEEDGSYRSYVPATASPNTTSGQVRSIRRTAALQDQIDDTIAVMQENVDKVIQRGEKIGSLQDRTENQELRTAVNRARMQQGWLSMLSAAWNNLPSPQATIASASELLQEKFAAIFYNGGYPEVNIMSTGDNTVPASGTIRSPSPARTAKSHRSRSRSRSRKPSHSRRGSSPEKLEKIIAVLSGMATVPEFSPSRTAKSHKSHKSRKSRRSRSSSSSDSRSRIMRRREMLEVSINDQIFPTKEIMSIGDQVTTDDPIFGNQGGLMSLGDQVATNDIMPIGDKMSPTKQVRSEDETVATNEIISIGDQGIDSMGGTQDLSLEFLLKEWTTLYD